MFVNFNILNQLGSPAINSNTFANRPAAGQTGRLFVSTDTFEIYRDNGTSWDLIGGPGSSTITGTGTATQVAYFTSSQAIGSSANLFWDNTSGFLGVATATPTARIEAVKTDGIGIYANYTTNAGSGSSATAIWAKNVTNSSGFAAVIEETTPNATAGQYPLLIKHSLSSGTAGVGMGTGIHWQLPDDAGTFKTTQLTIETINAAAATYATRYRFNVQSNGSSTPVAYINATGLGIFTATPGAALDIHSTGVIAQFNTTSATGNTYVSFQRTGTGVWRIGDTYNSGANFFGLFNNSISTNAIAVLAATNKTEFTAVENYTTGLARGNYFDYNLNVPAGGSFSSPNAITALTATLDLTLAGSATIPSGARSGLDAYNSIAFTGGGGTLTHNQGTQIRAYSNVTAGWAFNGSAVGTITHLAGLRALFPDNSGSAVNVTNNYALLLNDQTANTGTVTYTNRWGVYQEGASDLNYFAANTLIGTTVNNGDKLQVSGSVSVSNNITAGNYYIPAGSAGTVGLADLSAAIQFYSASVAPASDILFYTGGANTMILNETGNLGIGVSPSYKLSVAGVTKTEVQSGAVNNTAPAAIIVANKTTGAHTSSLGSSIQFEYTNSGGSYSGGLISSVGGADPFTADLRFFYRNYGYTEAMRITSSGLVGIGTSTPAYLLDVAGNGIVLNLNSNNSNQNKLIFSDNGTIRGSLGASSTRALTITDGSFNNLAQVTNAGNFLIGTTTDAGDKLQVNGRIVSSLDITAAKNLSAQGTFQGFNGAGVFLSYESYGGRLESYDYNTASYKNIFIAPNGGDVSIGSTGTTGDKLYVAGSIRTAAPNTGTAASWKLGSRVAATVVVNTTQYIEIDIGGTLYKLATVT